MLPELLRLERGACSGVAYRPGLHWIRRGCCCSRRLLCSSGGGGGRREGHETVLAEDVREPPPLFEKQGVPRVPRDVHLRATNQTGEPLRFGHRGQQSVAFARDEERAGRDFGELLFGGDELAHHPQAVHRGFFRHQLAAEGGCDQSSVLIREPLPRRQPRGEAVRAERVQSLRQKRHELRPVKEQRLPPEPAPAVHHDQSMHLLRVQRSRLERYARTPRLSDERHRIINALPPTLLALRAYHRRYDTSQLLIRRPVRRRHGEAANIEVRPQALELAPQQQTRAIEPGRVQQQRQMAPLPDRGEPRRFARAHGELQSGLLDGPRVRLCGGRERALYRRQRQR
mmetsp:Transcript_11122/g.36607  ORF Transcript_11122/g.36607 Transcript_11122/m.36607 type:complete len:342 (-) Transcript_11122:153-1178(-)